MLDDEGYLYFKGRVTDLIIQGGVEIYPPEIEQVLLASPAVREAVVVGRPAMTGGEEAVACVVRAGELRHEDLVAQCRSRLTSDKQPRLIFYVASLPKTTAGKVDRPKVRAMAARLPGSTTA
jgi:acyl-CoA synthetase (AMP-forming)/AMP-acid ligase II